MSRSYPDVYLDFHAGHSVTLFRGKNNESVGNIIVIVLHIRFARISGLSYTRVCARACAQVCQSLSQVLLFELPRLPFQHASLSCLCPLQQSFEVDTLRSLDRQTEGAVPDELRQRTKSSADAEDGSVVERFVESVMVEEHSRS